MLVLICPSPRRSGSVPTDRLFTGQRLDQTDLYFYNARYYDATIGRFVSPDTLIPNPANPQSFNRYSYVLNNPLKYTDPSGYRWVSDGDDYYDTKEKREIVREIITRNATLETLMLIQMSEVFENESPSKKIVLKPSETKGTSATMVFQNFSFGIGITITIGSITDQNGNKGDILSFGFGGGTPCISGGIIHQATNARTIYDLEGWGTEMGGSLGLPFIPISGNVEYTAGQNRSWEGNNVGGGIGVPFIEIHGYVTYTWVYVFNITDSVSDRVTIPRY
ncbi:MAG: RHS repeat-associated core domain-containing protein [Chloroflexi bacterium]|nr:RHS repeat-associated core domain-containing protein [Chloroflexota bacterium]